MTTSIAHRATGTGLATVGAFLLVWWLAATATGADAYKTFADVFTRDDGALNPFGWVVGVALTWAVFQHMASGIRHLILDTGAAFELKINRALALATFAFSVIATAAFWLYLGMR